MKVFFEKLESWLHAKSYGDTKRALQDFAIFDPMANPRDFSYLPPEKIEQLQDRFLSNCQTMLLSAGFKPVTREELMWALGEDYLSTIPIEINWDALDKGLFKLYREQRDTTAEGNVADVGLPPESEKREQAFLPSNRVWVFRRGIGTTRTKDYFFFQKLDHMISMVYGWLLERIRSVFGKIAPPRAQAPLQPEVPEGASIQPLAENQPADGDTNVIQRVTLHDEVAEKGIKCLFEKSILEEATYKEVLVLYRRATPTEESPDPTESSAKNNRAIFIKVFHDIPIADLEMVFPEKRVRMRPMDLVWITATTGVGLITFALGLSDQLTSWLGLAAMVTLVVLAGRSFMTYRYSMLYTKSSMLSFLYDKSLDTHKGALLYLQDRLKSQELKECAVLYFFLWHGGPQTINELGQACEGFLLETQQEKAKQLNIRFAVKDVLTKLLQWGIAVEAHGQQQQQDKTVGETGEEAAEEVVNQKHYGALSPDKAISILEQHWDSLFNNNTPIPASSSSSTTTPFPMMNPPSQPSTSTPK